MYTGVTINTTAKEAGMAPSGKTESSNSSPKPGGANSLTAGRRLVADLRDFRTSSIEEFGQFAIGEFLVAGAFWLGVERFITTENWRTDVLFWICAVTLVAGLVIGFFGFKQLSRRKTRIDKLIESGTPQETATDAT
jgi:hypothetical protein